MGTKRGDNSPEPTRKIHQGKGDPGVFGACRHPQVHPLHHCRDGDPSAFLLWSMARPLCLCLKASGNENKFDFIFGLQDQRIRHPACLCATSFSVLRRWKKERCFTFSPGKQRHSDLSRETKEKEDSHISLKPGACSYFCTVHPVYS